MTAITRGPRRAPGHGKHGRGQGRMHVGEDMLDLVRLIVLWQSQAAVPDGRVPRRACTPRRTHRPGSACGLAYGAGLSIHQTCERRTRAIAQRFAPGNEMIDELISYCEFVAPTIAPTTIGLAYCTLRAKGHDLLQAFAPAVDQSMPAVCDSSARLWRCEP
jgi:hypothetical protein